MTDRLGRAAPHGELAVVSSPPRYSSAASQNALLHRQPHVTAARWGMSRPLSAHITCVGAPSRREPESNRGILMPRPEADEQAVAFRRPQPRDRIKPADPALGDRGGHVDSRWATQCDRRRACAPGDEEPMSRVAAAGWLLTGGRGPSAHPRGSHHERRVGRHQGRQRSLPSVSLVVEEIAPRSHRGNPGPEPT